MSNISFTTYNDENQNTAEFLIEGEATIRNELDLYNLLIIKIEEHNNFVIKLIDIKNIDLSFIQLLLSFEKTIKNSGKKVSFKIELADASNIILKNAGIDITKLFKTVELKITNLS
jgi:ABC-type transporter Mla MlaB component